jgi:hypothetical protein
MNGHDYLDLLIRSLSGELSDEVIYRNLDMKKALEEGQNFPTIFSLEACRTLLQQAQQEFESYLAPLGKSAEEVLEMDAGRLFDYLNWMNPIGAPHTMGGRAMLESLHELLNDVLDHNVPGDFIETGVWKGGMVVFMRGVLRARGCRDRRVWVADSFQGLPKPNPHTHLKDALFWYLMYPLGHLTIPLEYVQGLFERYGLLDEQVRFLPGWFQDTLPNADIEQLALARLDGDLYESTYQALEALYPRLSPGGILIADDYGVPCGCQKAVDDYRAAHGLDEPMTALSNGAVYWRKS